MATVYYRYICNVQERNQLVAERKVLSINSTTGYVTWYTPTRYNNANDAQRELALPSPDIPLYRVGPIPETLMPALIVGPRRVPPGFGQPGGGIEIATDVPVWLYSGPTCQDQKYEKISFIRFYFIVNLLPPTSSHDFH